MQIYLLEEPNMKKIVALVLSLVMALSLCTVAFADGYDIEVTKKGEHTKYDELKSVAQTDTVLPHYEGKANGEWFVETADPDVYDSASNFIVTYQRDGKIVYLLRVEKDDLKVNALKADAVAEHKYVGCGDNTPRLPRTATRTSRTAITGSRATPMTLSLMSPSMATMTMLLPFAPLPCSARMAIGIGTPRSFPPAT